MSFKFLLPLGVLVGLVSGSYYLISPPFDSSAIDYQFYSNPELFNRFQKHSLSFKKEIINDDIEARDYFFQNSLSFMWKEENKNDDIEYGNGFILNVVYPEHLNLNHPDRNSYVPKSYSGTSDITLLVGTTLSFVQKIFNVSNFKTDVNENENCKSINSSGDSGTSSNKKLYISHPYPVSESDLGLGTRSKTTQDFLYRWEDNDSIYENYDFGLKKPFFIKLKPENVCLVYAAADLEIRKDSLNFSISQSPKLKDEIVDFQNRETQEFIDKVKNIYGKEYKLAADFAVMQVKLSITDVKYQYLRYLTDLYRKTTVLPKIYTDDFKINLNKTQKLYLAGWEKLTPEEVDFHAMKNLFVQAKVIDSNRSSKKPSEDNDIEIEVYDKFSDKEAKNPKKSEDFEIAEKTLHPNDSDGVLYINYKLKSKKTGKVYPETQYLIFSGYKPTSTSNSAIANHLSSWNNDFYAKNRRLRDFLEAKPRATSRWREYELGYAYFPFKTVKDYVFDRSPILGGVNEINMTNPLTTFKLGNTEYINIGHHLIVPNLHSDNYKGAPVLVKDSRTKLKTVLGMYVGTSEWNNPLSDKKRIGEIMMFISPWSYDLFNKSNKLSKPSLADSIDKKSKIKDFIVQKTRWSER